MAKKIAKKTTKRTTEKKSKSTLDLDAKLIRKMGLSSERIQMHASRIRAALSGQTNTSIPVSNSCTVDNGGIIAWNALEEWLADAAALKGESYFSDAHHFWARNHLVTMVPAAGAASRFLGELQKFTNEVESHVEGLSDAITKKSTKALPQAEKFQTSAAKISMKPAIALLPDMIEQQEFLDVVREYIRLGVLLGIFFDVEFSQSNNKKDKKNEPTFSAREWRSHWDNLLNNQTESNGCYESDESDESDESYKDSDNDCDGCSNCSCGSDESSEGCCSDGECEGCDCDTESDTLQPTSVIKAYAAAKAILNLYAGQPKALVPTTNEGDSFLRLKMAEQVSLLPNLGNILVVPAGQKKNIGRIVKHESEYITHNYSNVFELAGTPFAPSWLKSESRETGHWVIMEQGNDLSTIRFDLEGNPIVEKGKYSPVAAGHGELVHLFSQVSSKFPKAECLHVRNIDNVIGATVDTSVQLSELADGFRLIRDAIEFLRAEVTHHLSASRAQKNPRIQNIAVCLALDFLGALIQPETAEEALMPCFSSDGDFIGVSAQSMFNLLCGLFHWNQPTTDKKTQNNTTLWRHIQENLDRPLSVFGVVKKDDADVGGGPVFIQLPDGKTAKLCMEMPHASAEDSKKYFGPGGSCSHFNPVLTFFELKTHDFADSHKKTSGRKVDFRRLFDDRFWMLSRKEYQGKSVCYHETVLYELIGNSATTNLVFFEVPRSLFVPHKTIFESLGRSREFYGFSETLGKLKIDMP